MKKFNNVDVYHRHLSFRLMNKNCCCIPSSSSLLPGLHLYINHIVAILYGIINALLLEAHQVLRILDESLRIILVYLV